MKLVIISPLYPPDTAPSALYVKELATRIIKERLADVSIVTYGNIPEKIEGVKIFCTSKRKSLFVRLFLYTRLLFAITKDADFLFVENGPSVELPMSIVGSLRKLPIVFHIGDTAAHKRAKESVILNFLETALVKRSILVVHHMPLSRPEVLPYQELPPSVGENYEKSWTEHLAIIKPFLTT